MNMLAPSLNRRPQNRYPIAPEGSFASPAPWMPRMALAVAPARADRKDPQCDEGGLDQRRRRQPAYRCDDSRGDNTAGGAHQARGVIRRSTDDR